MSNLRVRKNLLDRISFKIKESNLCHFSKLPLFKGSLFCDEKNRAKIKCLGRIYVFPCVNMCFLRLPSLSKYIGK